jgi:hypothetical protein
MSNLAGVAGVPVEHAIQLLLVLGLPPAPKRREEPPRGKPAAWMGSTGSPVVEGPDPPTGTDIDWVPLYV